MKNQYFGDINDYRKYGLLRVLSVGGAIKLGICWMLTRNDGSTDGRFRKYLKEPARWGRLDQRLFACLRKCGRNVEEAEKHRIFHSARFWKQVLADDEESRRKYFHGMTEHFKGVDLVFFDPDNGFEVKSKPYGKKRSSKYLYWHELEKCFETGCSVLVYQHFRREKRASFIKRVAKQIQQRTKANPVYSFRTPRVVFFLAPQRQHHRHFAHRVTELQPWESQITAHAHRF
jgi:hypothetical protein